MTRTLLDVISGVKVANPEDMIISREEFSDIESKMNDILSDLEWKVLMSYLDGKSYQEIAAELGRHIKSIDNALQRVSVNLKNISSAKEILLICVQFTADCWLLIRMSVSRIKIPEKADN